MFIHYQQLSHLPVFNESGAKLGTVHDVEIDVEAHAIRKYIVSHGIAGLTKETFLVTPGQVKSIDAEKMIVVDTIIKDTGEAPASYDPAPISPSHPPLL